MLAILFSKHELPYQTQQMLCHNYLTAYLRGRPPIFYGKLADRISLPSQKLHNIGEFQYLVSNEPHVELQKYITPTGFLKAPNSTRMQIHRLSESLFYIIFEKLENLAMLEDSNTD